MCIHRFCCSGGDPTLPPLPGELQGLDRPRGHGDYDGSGHQEQPREIQTSLLRRFEIDDVDRFTEHNIKDHLVIKPNEDGKGRTLTMAYEARGPLLGNLDVVLKFDKSILIPGTGQGE